MKKTTNILAVALTAPMLLHALGTASAVAGSDIDRTVRSIQISLDKNILRVRAVDAWRYPASDTTPPSIRIPNDVLILTSADQDFRKPTAADVSPPPPAREDIYRVRFPDDVIILKASDQDAGKPAPADTSPPGSAAIHERARRFADDWWSPSPWDAASKKAGDDVTVLSSADRDKARPSDVTPGGVIHDTAISDGDDDPGYVPPDDGERATRIPLDAAVIHGADQDTWARVAAADVALHAVRVDAKAYLQSADDDAIALPAGVVICWASPNFHTDVSCEGDGAYVTMNYFGLWPDTCVPQEPKVHVDGNRIEFFTRYWEDPTIGCGDLPTFYAVTATVGPLASGVYEVYTTIHGVNSRGTRTQQESLRIRCPVVQQCYANCDASRDVPILNVSDFACFLQRYSAGDPWANCDRSTTAPVLNIADFSCFLAKFAAGCN